MSVTHGGKFRVGLKGLADNYIEVSVLYRKAGINYFNHTEFPGGIYLSVCLMEVETFDGIRMERYTMGSGKGVLVEPAARLNRKRLVAVLEQAKADVTNRSGLGWDVIKPILDVNGYEVADEATTKQEAP